MATHIQIQDQINFFFWSDQKKIVCDWTALFAVKINGLEKKKKRKKKSTHRLTVLAQRRDMDGV